MNRKIEFIDEELNTLKEILDDYLSCVEDGVIFLSNTNVKNIVLKENKEKAEYLNNFIYKIKQKLSY